MKTIKELEQEIDQLRHRINFIAKNGPPPPDPYKRHDTFQVWVDNEYSLRMEYMRLTDELLLLRGIKPA
jgi:hypothetical protein